MTARSKCVSPINPGRRKRTFRSAAAARKFVRRDSGLHRHGRYPYFCSDCRGWHLSHLKPLTPPAPEAA